MKKLLSAVALLFFAVKLFAAQTDIDSLKQQLRVAQSDSVKVILYNKLTESYLKTDSLANGRAGTIYQDEAINYLLKAVHVYSRFNDTLGLRNSFDRLAFLYHKQDKNVQAKWFILQSNTLSRAKNDIPNIINSLLTLVAIQTDQEDYDLVPANLVEAQSLAHKYHYLKLEAKVQQQYAFFYNRTKDYDKAEAALKRYDSITDNLKKDEEARLMSRLNKQNETLNKKKTSSNSDSSAYKSNYLKRIASL